MALAVFWRGLRPSVESVRNPEERLNSPRTAFAHAVGVADERVDNGKRAGSARELEALETMQRFFDARLVRSA